MECGKTTTTVNLGTILAKKGKKVLMVDADPQGNATSGIGVDKEAEYSVYDVLVTDIEIEKTIIIEKENNKKIRKLFKID